MFVTWCPICGCLPLSSCLQLPGQNLGSKQPTRTTGASKLQNRTEANELDGETLSGMVLLKKSLC